VCRALLKSGLFTITVTVAMVSLTVPSFADTSLWLEESKKKGCCKGGEPESGAKTVTIRKGTVQENTIVRDVRNGVVYIRETDNTITQQKVTNGEVSFTPKYKGSYQLFFEHKEVHEGILEVTLSTLRIYNKEGEIVDSLLKEVRGKTHDSQYGREPFAPLPFDLILQRPIKRHHINCCLYSGDIVPFKLYYRGELLKNVPLSVQMETGWTNRIAPSEDGTVSFEIPRITYPKSEKEKKHSEKMVVEAAYDLNESGVYGGEAYHGVHYVMSMPLSFGASPLEYESKTLGFATAVGVMLVFSLGLYYHRRRKRKTPKEIYFDEE
jgi:hypothetical protein